MENFFNSLDLPIRFYKINQLLYNSMRRIKLEYIVWVYYAISGRLYAEYNWFRID